MMKDWIGNKLAVFTCLGASSHSDLDREKNDYYATEPKAIDLLVAEEKFNNNIWECACGEGHLSKKLEEYGYKVTSTDLIPRGYGLGGVDFLKHSEPWDGDIITNPPYKHAREFVEKALGLVGEGSKVAMFLKIQFLEGKERRKLFNLHPPKIVYVSSSRLKCAKNGDFESYPSSALCYCWFVWEKGFTGSPVIKWVN